MDKETVIVVEMSQYLFEGSTHVGKIGGDVVILARKSVMMRKDATLGN